MARLRQTGLRLFRGYTPKPDRHEGRKAEARVKRSKSTQVRVGY